MPQPFHIFVRVYIEDTDAGGIVYYANYLKYMERARTEFMRSLGIGKSFFFERPEMFVVHALQIEYCLPARLDDQLTITARVLKTGRASLLFEQKVLAGEKLLVTGQVKIACVDKLGLKPAAMPPQIRHALVVAS